MNQEAEKIPKICISGSEALGDITYKVGAKVMFRIDPEGEVHLDCDEDLSKASKMFYLHVQSLLQEYMNRVLEKKLKGIDE